MTVDEDILILEPRAPLVDIIENNAGWDSRSKRCFSLTGKLLYKAPIPHSFSTDPGYLGTTPNMGLAVLMADGRTVKQNQPFHRCGPGGDATSQFLFPDVDIETGDGIDGSHGGSGMSSIGGTLRLGELVPGGVIRHAIKCNLFGAKYMAYNDDGTRGYRWPARRADAYAAGNYQGKVPALEMGALLSLKPDFDLDALRTEPARILARAFADYGAYLVDDSAWDVYAIETEWSPQGRVIDEFESVWGWEFETPVRSTCADTSKACMWAKDMADIFTKLHVVDNNASGSIGGGGFPRQPLAPPLGSIAILKSEKSEKSAKAAKDVMTAPFEPMGFLLDGRRRALQPRIGTEFFIRAAPPF